MSLMHETDIPSNLACLKNIDTLLRCPICFDFVNIAMMTKCSHNYCSLCIRKCLSYKLQCPVCNSPTTGQDLRNNRVLDDLVTSFQTARKQLSKVNFDSPPISPNALATECNSPKQRVPTKDGSILSHFLQKGPTTPSRDRKALDFQRAQPTVYPTRGRKRPSQPVSVIDCSRLHSPEPSPPVRVKEEPVEEELPAQVLLKVKQESLNFSHEDPQPPKVILPSTSSQDIKPVKCPVCSVAIAQHFINKHLDTCLTRGEKKGSLRSSPTALRRPTMAKLVYTLLTTQDLKKRLKECHLSIQGTRDELVRRHQDFVQSYNSECDSLSPRSAEEIAKEVEAIERTKNHLKRNRKQEMVFTKNQSLEEIDKIHSSYRKQHSSEFSRLVAQVRGRLETGRQTPIKQESCAEGEEDKGAHCTDNAADPKDSTNSPPPCVPMTSVAAVGEEEKEEEVEAKELLLPSSPAHSEVSVSSSISDIFRSEPEESFENIENVLSGKRTSGSRDRDAVSPLSIGKRPRNN